MERGARTEEKWIFAHGLEARLTVVEQRPVAGRQNDQHALLRLHFAPLDLRLQESASFASDGLQKSIKSN